MEHEPTLMEGEDLKAEVEELRAKLEEKDRKIKELEELATKDHLTKIYNRRGLEEVTKKFFEEQREGAAERRELKPASILILDVDNFKVINDLMGHDAGDTVLKDLARYLEGKVRHGDVVARWGGEEFIVFFNNATAHDVIDASYRWRGGEGSKEEGRAKINFETTIGDETMTITASGGVTELYPGEPIDHAITRADEALQRAKEAGKDRIVNGDKEQ